MGYYDYSYASFEDLEGRTIKAIEVEKVNDDCIKFAMDNGDVYRMDHSQECCEYVYIEDICGDLEDLIDMPILVAEERSEEGDDPEGYGIQGWTFYELRTIKGSVTIRWNGSSNGYYSIGVGFVKLRTEEQKQAA